MILSLPKAGTSDPKVRACMLEDITRGRRVRARTMAKKKGRRKILWWRAGFRVEQLLYGQRAGNQDKSGREQASQSVRMNREDM